MDFFPRHSKPFGKLSKQWKEWRIAIISLGLLQFFAAVYDMRFPLPESQ